MSRIAAAICRMEKQIEARIEQGLTTQAQVNETHTALDMDIGEYVRFQELKSLAVADNTLTLDEGQLVYRYLGNSPGVFNGQPVAVKAVLTTLFKQLMEKRIGKKKV